MSKSIILFSDGTGNSSAKLFKTNVWRMYEAVDLGPPAEGKRDQISYYDDGVGTSSFKPLTVLGGAFGWGLQRNVLDIYRYACRNYREGDDIYAFGFSRGAFTVRLVVALIASEGLVDSTSEAELDRKSREAYRNFRAAFLPRRLQWPTKLLRSARAAIDRWLARRKDREPYDPADNCWPKVRFVGVWDTVSAYGGPIAEITRAIDNWIYPLSMPNYQLNEHVQCARHALAIDDERDAFHPLLWDELHEQQLADEGKVTRGRLQQVWFTGMHADVGGGYPDESLSYVSLLWMMEEAENAGLRTLKVVKDRIVALASSYGPIHDSRAGLAAYYRYQPRKIAAWLDPVDPTTLSLRDPAIVDSHATSRGLLCSVSVHESVINRIANGTDRYAPITLPETFSIVPPQVEGETVPQPDNQTPDPLPESQTPKPMVSRDVCVRLTEPTAAGARAAATEPIWNFVWWRRLTYFATLTATLLLLILPLVAGRLPPPPILADGRTWIGGIIRLLTIVLPAFAGEWVEAYANNPFYFLVLAGFIVLFFKLGTRLERTLRDNLGLRARIRELDAATFRSRAALAPWLPFMTASTTYRPFKGERWFDQYRTWERTDGHSGDYNIGIGAALPVGTTFSLGWAQGTYNQFTTYDPEIFINNPLDPENPIPVLANNEFHTRWSALSFRLNQSLLRGISPAYHLGSSWQAELAVDSADVQRDQEMATVVADTLRAYWDLVAARENLVIAEESRAFAAGQREVTEARIAAGDLAEIERMRIDESVATKSSGVLDARRLVEEAEGRLKLVLGAELDDPLMFAEIVPSDGVDLPLPARDRDASLQTALTQNHDLRLARGSLSARRIRWAADKHARLPTLDLRTSLTLSGRGFDAQESVEDVFSPKFPDFEFGLDFRMPIPDLGSWNAARASGADVEAALLTMQQAERSVLGGIEAALLSVRSSEALIGVAQIRIALAARTAEAAEATYAVGRNTLRDVLEAQQALDAARQSDVAARVQAQRARIDLEVLRGTLLGTLGIELE